MSKPTAAEEGRDRVLEPHEAAALAAWRELTPALRAKMAAQGITGPDFSYTVPGGASAEGEEEEGEWARTERTLGREDARTEEPAAELCERVPGLSLEQAEQIVEWHAAEMKELSIEENARLLHGVFSIFIQPKLNKKLLVYALAFAAGLDQVAGLGSQNECATRLGEDRAKLNYYVSMWRKTLHLEVRMFCRGGRARRAYQLRAAREHRKAAAKKAEYEKGFPSCTS